MINIPISYFQYKHISYFKILANSLIFTTILPFLPYMLIKIPYISDIMTSVGNMSLNYSIILDKILKISSIIITYVSMNMYNGRAKNKSCNTKYKKMNIFILIVITKYNIMVMS